MAKNKYVIKASADPKWILGNYVYEHIFDIYKEMCSKTVRTAYNYGKNLAKKTIESFYKDYTPFEKSYDRTGDLFNAYDIGIRDGYELVFELGSEFMEHYHHQENDLVYWIAFVNGSHGGFPHNGSMYWRTPIPEFSAWYPTPAPLSTSPRDTIVNKWNIFIENTYKPLQISEFNKILGRIKNELGV